MCTQTHVNCHATNETIIFSYSITYILKVFLYYSSNYVHCMHLAKNYIQLNSLLARSNYVCNKCTLMHGESVYSSRHIFMVMMILEYVHWV